MNSILWDTLGFPRRSEVLQLGIYLARTLETVPRGLLLEIMAPVEQEVAKPGWYPPILTHCGLISSNLSCHQRDMG